MGMTINESLEWLVSRKEHYEMDDNCQELAQALEVAIDTMRKYQKIKETINKWCADKTWEFDTSYLYEIMEIIEDGNDD